MEVRPFDDEYELAAPLYGMTTEELRLRDISRKRRIERWLVLEGGRAVGASSVIRRPDDRTFVDLRGRPALYERLLEAVSGVHPDRLYSRVDESATATLRVLTRAGFVTEVVNESFRLSFASALSVLSRAWIPTGISLIPADEADESRLFSLDNTLRQDVPGVDGWRGDRQLFREELTEAPPFEPAAYPVAVDDANGEYAGLARMWRNPSGPRLGLIGVLRQYRNTPIAAALLYHALRAAAAWGYPSLTTDTSPTNHVVHRRLLEVGAESLGRSLQLVRP